MITSEREASALAQTILNSAPFFIEFWDADGNMLECNDKMLRVFEVTDKHAFAKNFFDFCVPIQPCGTPAVQLNDKMIQIAMEQGSTRAEWLYLMPDGSELPVEAVWVHAHHNGKPIIIVYSIDLRPVKTAMEREQAAIAKERKAFETIQQIFDLAPTMINQWDSNYNMIKSSRKAVEWYGVSSEQEYIDRFGDLAPECQPCGTPTLQKAKEFVAEAFEKGSASFEWMTLTTNGEPLPLWVDLVRASTDEGAIVYAFTNDLRPIEAIKGKAYEAEKKQREQFQIIVDASPYMCTVFDEIGNVIDCNKVTLDYFELSSKQEYMGCFHDLIPEYQPNGTHSATAVIENTKRVIKTGELLTYFNWVMHTKSGEPRHMEVIKTAVIISGEIHVIVYARDLQEHFRMVAAEEALHKKEFEYELQKQKQEAHEWNQAFIDNSPHIISIWNSDMKLAMASKAAVERFGIESPEVFIEQFGDFSPKYQPCGALSSELAVSYMQQAMDEGSVTFEWMHKTADGDPRPSEIVAKRFTRNDENVVIVFNSDLREIKAAEEKERVLREELLYREKLLAAGNQTAKVLLTASTIDTIMDGMEIIGHLLNVDRTQIWHFGEVNGEGCFMLQYEWLSERGKQKNGYPKGFVYPRSRDAEWFDNTLLAGVNINCPISELPPVIEAYYGGFDVVSTAIFPMILNDEIVGIFAVQDCELVRTFTKDEMDIMASTGMMFTSVYNNIKQQEERQRMKIAEESNHAKSVFLARMSHEIRTPISAVMGISEIELQSRELDARTEEAFAKIHNSANSLLGLVNDILDLSKIEAGKMELTTSKYKMSHVILDISQIHLAFVGSRDIKFIMQVDETLPQYLVGDPLRIVQIASNVLSNAFKYTMEGTVHLSFSCEQRSRDKITLVLAVRDSGLGMSDEQLSGLSNDYIRHHEKDYRFIEGTGLGMPIVFNLAKLMNAEIKIDSEVDVGTNVVIKIPQVKASDELLGMETSQRLEQLEETTKAFNNKLTFEPEYMPYGKILIVDDVDANLFVAKGLMAFYGLQIEACISGYAAIDKIKQGNVYDIIFMDYMMPGINGTQTMHELRALGYDRPIVALTANAMIGQAEEFMREGFDGFVSKPIQAKQLNNVLVRHIKDKQSPEVIEAAQKAKADRPKGDINSFQRDPDLVAKLRVDFKRSHQCTMNRIVDAMAANDHETAHRLAHTIKGSAGLIYEDTLVAASKEVERAFIGKSVPSSKRLSALKRELDRVLDDIGDIGTNDGAGGEQMNTADAAQLLQKVIPLLQKRNTHCVTMCDDLRKIPNSEELVGQIQRFQLAKAAETATKLLSNLGEF